MSMMFLCALLFGAVAVVQGYYNRQAVVRARDITIDKTYDEDITIDKKNDEAPKWCGWLKVAASVTDPLQTEPDVKGTWTECKNECERRTECVGFKHWPKSSERECCDNMRRMHWVTYEERCELLRSTTGFSGYDSYLVRNIFTTDRTKAHLEQRDMAVYVNDNSGSCRDFKFSALECEDGGFIAGDGNGQSEKRIYQSNRRRSGFRTRKECIDAIRSDQPTANGATVYGWSDFKCYAEFNLPEKDYAGSGNGYAVCKFKPPVAWDTFPQKWCDVHSGAETIGVNDKGYSESKCKSECAVENNCNYASFDSNNGWCTLFSSCGTPTSDPHRWGTQDPSTWTTFGKRAP